MVRQDHQLSGHESEQTLGDGRQRMTEEPGVLQSTWLLRVRHDIVIEQQTYYEKNLSLCEYSAYLNT